MFNEAHISLSGYVASQPELRETRTGVPAVSMRVAWTPRRIDRGTGEWVNGDTSFATVKLYRRLAENAARCLRKGDPVVVRGRVSVREFEGRNGQQRTNVEIDAQSVGHDLGYGIATFHRVRPQSGMTAAEFRAAEEAGLNGGTGGAIGGLDAGDPDDIAVPAASGAGLAGEARPARVASFDTGEDPDMDADPDGIAETGDGTETADDRGTGHGTHTSASPGIDDGPGVNDGPGLGAGPGISDGEAGSNGDDTETSTADGAAGKSRRKASALAKV